MGAAQRFTTMFPAIIRERPAILTALASSLNIFARNFVNARVIAGTDSPDAAAKLNATPNSAPASWLFESVTLIFA